jgi:hypothetical protein
MKYDGALKNKNRKKPVDTEAHQTVGAQYLAEAFKEPDTRDPIELQREMQSKYVDNLILCTQNFRKSFDNQDFFVVVLTKRERIMQKLFRLYYTARHSCPTPEYDQSVYHYNYKDERLSFLWTVPDKDSCYHLRDNALMVHPEEKQLLQFVMDFFDGTLLEVSKKLNKDTE